MNRGGDIDMSGTELLITIFLTIWLSQIMIAWANLFMGEFDKRRTLLWWHVPILFLVQPLSEDL